MFNLIHFINPFGKRAVWQLDIDDEATTDVGVWSGVTNQSKKIK